MPCTITHRMDLLAVQEMVMARAVPKPTPTFAAFLVYSTVAIRVLEVVCGPSHAIRWTTARCRPTDARITCGARTRFRNSHLHPRVASGSGGGPLCRTHVS